MPKTNGEMSETEKATAVFLNDMQRNAGQVHLAAELALRRIAAQPDPIGYVLRFDPGDALLLRMAGYDTNDDTAMRRALGRVRKETSLREVYRGEQALRDAQVLATAAHKKCDVGLPEIDAKMKDLEKLEAALLLEHSAAQQVVDAMVHAREELRSAAPPHIADRAATLAARVRDGDLGARVRELDQQRNRCLEIIERATSLKEREHASLTGEEAEALDAALRELPRAHAELAELNAALTTAKSERDAAMAEASSAVAAFVEHGLEGQAA